MTLDEIERQKRLRNSLILACENYNADEAVRAMASAMTTLLIGVTKDRDAALIALDKIYTVMRSHVEATARPPGTTQQ